MSAPVLDLGSGQLQKSARRLRRSPGGRKEPREGSEGGAQTPDHHHIPGEDSVGLVVLTRSRELVQGMLHRRNVRFRGDREKGPALQALDQLCSSACTA
eukprot:1843143-Rhodomonas_salina.3